LSFQQRIGPMPVTTLLDIAKANGSDAAVGLIEEVMT
jgi:hypothetical protein